MARAVSWSRTWRKGILQGRSVTVGPENPLRVIGRTRNYILEPEMDCEINGYYKGCVFPTGNVIVDNTLYVYYGAADKYVCMATCDVKELIQYIKKGE